MTPNQHAQLVTLIRTGFARTEERFEGLALRIGALEGRLEAVETRLEGVEDRVGSLEVRIGALEDSVQSHGRLLRILIDHSASLAERITVLEVRQARVEEVMTDVRLQLGAIAPAA